MGVGIVRRYVTELVPSCRRGVSGVGVRLVPDFLFAAALVSRWGGGFIFIGRAGPCDKSVAITVALDRKGKAVDLICC